MVNYELLINDHYKVQQAFNLNEDKIYHFIFI